MTHGQLVLLVSQMVAVTGTALCWEYLLRSKFFCLLLYFILLASTALVLA